MSDKEPLHVQFARLCMGWTDIQPGQMWADGREWRGISPRHAGCGPEWCDHDRRFQCRKGREVVPRVDLPGQFDLMPWEEANRIVCTIRADDRWGADAVEFDHVRLIGAVAKTKREAVLRCLIALAEAGKLVKP